MYSSIVRFASAKVPGNLPRDARFAGEGWVRVVFEIKPDGGRCPGTFRNTTISNLSLVQPRPCSFYVAPGARPNHQYTIHSFFYGLSVTTVRSAGYSVAFHDEIFDRAARA